MTLRHLPRLAHYFFKDSAVYILGAGASSEAVAFGPKLVGKIASDFRMGGSFPIELPQRDERTEKIISLNLRNNYELLSGDELWNELITRLSPSFVKLNLFYHLANPAYLNAAPYNYLIFNYFKNSTIVNYNLDGLASRYCQSKHNIIDVHGTVPSGYGSPDTKALLSLVQDYDLSLDIQGNHILFEKEKETDLFLQGQLMKTANAIEKCKFVCIIGYSFAQSGNNFDDALSLDFISNSLLLQKKPLCILDPNPLYLREFFMDKLKTKSVFSFPVFWNILAEAMVRNCNDLEHLDYHYSRLCDERGH